MKKIEIQSGELQEMSISSQTFTKDGKWEILKKYRYCTESGNIKYKVTLRCVECGYTKTVGLHHTYSSSICPTCFRNRHIGKIIGCYKVVKFEEYDEERLKEYYELECIKCGKHYHHKLLNEASMQNIQHCAHCNGVTEDPGINSMYRDYIAGAKDRNLEFKLTNDEFLKLIKSNCYYCGDGPELRTKTSTKGHLYQIVVNGIDRVDSSKGYTTDNSN